MAKDSQISWTDHTWNVVLGCDRVSAGCDNCYAITNARIRESHPNPKVAGPYEGLVEHRDGRLDWTGKVRFVEDRLDQPLRWRKPARIFVNAQSDLFHKDVTDEQIARVWAVMALTPQHTYQILTKRPARMRALLSAPSTEPDAFIWKVKDAMWNWALPTFGKPAIRGRRALNPTEWWPLPNLWLGTSVEDQKAADLRIPKLLDTPAAVRFLSCEPLLGPVDLTDWMGEWDLDGRPITAPGVDWVIAGGESGPGARPMHPDWARGLRDQCDHAGVAYLFKQWGEWAPTDQAPVSYGTKRSSMHTTPQGGTRTTLLTPDGEQKNTNDLTTFVVPAGWADMARVGKKRAGRLLDGRTHDDYPEAS